jgi:flagellar basal-body rod protein FlgB
MRAFGEGSVFALLGQRLDVLGTRQKLIAENVANVNTPGYRPRDVDMDGFEAQMAQQVGKGRGGTASRGVAIMRTNAMHMEGSSGGVASARVTSRADSETTIDGNGVVLEDQMLKLNETRLEFDTAIGLYQKALGLMRMAAKGPSR